MRRPILAAAAGAALLLTGAACGSDSDEALDPDSREVCQAYHQLVNNWSVDYGAEMGAVGQAAAAGDEERQETSVAVVRDLFATTASQMRSQADRTSHEELTDALNDAAEGLAAIASDIETYDDVTTAPEYMSSGDFAAAGGRVSSICAQ